MSAISEDQVCLLCLQSISGSLSYECKTGNENDLYSNVIRYDESLYVHGTNNLKQTVCLVNAYKKAVCSMCDWCQLVKPACTHSLCRHVIGAVCSSAWCVCVCKNVHIQVCVVHSENTPDASHNTYSSCRDWLLARHGKMDWRKLMSDSPKCRSIVMSDLPRRRYIFCRCCALATLDDTLHQSSVVGYMCKTIQ